MTRLQLGRLTLGQPSSLPPGSAPRPLVAEAVCAQGVYPGDPLPANPSLDDRRTERSPVGESSLTLEIGRVVCHPFPG